MTLQKIIHALYPNSILQRAWPLDGGISARMIGLLVEHPQGRHEQLLLRTYADGRPLNQEYDLLTFLQGQGLPVPPPLHYDSSRTLWDQPYLLLRYIPGKIEFAPRDLAHYLQQMARTLARIHLLPLPENKLTSPLSHFKTCPETIDALPPPQQNHFASLHKILLQRPMPGRRTALLHGDYWPGNVLWRGQQLAAIIDWEDSALGDPLADLARSRSEIAWIFGLDALSIFTTHYQAQIDLDYRQLPYWDGCALLRQLRLISGDYQKFAAFFAARGRPDISAASIEENLHRYFQLIS